MAINSGKLSRGARYIFSKYSERELISFLKASQNEKMKQCEMQLEQEEQYICKLLPLDRDIAEMVKSDGELDTNVVLISDSDSDPECAYEDDNRTVADVEDDRTADAGDNSNIMLGDKSLSVSSTEDLCGLMLENLQTDRALSRNVMIYMQAISVEELERVFSSLQDCTTDHIIYLGEALSDQNLTDNHAILTSYLHILFNDKLIQEYNIGLEKLLNKFSQKCGNPCLDLLLQKVLSSEEESRFKILSQYVGSMGSQHKAYFLRNLLSEVDKLEEQHLCLIEALLHDGLEYTVIKKLVDVMSSNADEFVNDKVYGRLLYSTVQLVGPHARNLEQPLKYILSRHRSIWKAKVQKLFCSYFQDSLLSQTMAF